MNTEILLCLLMVVFSQGEVILIFNINYWKEIVYQESDINAPIPSEIQHTTDNILVFTKIHTLSFKRSVFTTPKILPARKHPSQLARSVQDKAGNIIFNVNGYLFYTNKKTGDKKLITSQDLHQFKEVTMDEKRSIAYIIGQNSDGSLGQLFAFYTNEPVFNANQIKIKAISLLGQDIKTVSLDKETGNIAFIEGKEKHGWKLVLLVMNDFRFMVNSSEKPSKSDNEKVVISEKFHPGLRNDFNNAIKEMTTDILSLNNEECDKNVGKLLYENNRLRQHLMMMGKVHRYLLKDKGIYLSSPKYYYLETTKDNQKSKEEFVNTVRNLEKNITLMLNEKSVVWLDEDKTICNNVYKWIYTPLENGDKTEEIIDEHKKSCGILKTNPSTELFPWTVAILGSSLPHKFICYGTLIHPKVVAISIACRENYPNHGNTIARSGALDVSLLNTEQPEIDRKVASKTYVGVEALILSEEFSVGGKIEVVCSTLNRNEVLPGSKCFGLPKQNSLLKANVFDFSDIGQCDPAIADSRFLCIKQKEVDLKLCKLLNDDVFNHAIYCPSPGDQQRYTLYGIHFRWYNCTQVIVNQNVYDRQTADGLAKLNIDIRSFNMLDEFNNN